MDGHRFDEVARSIARGRASRRALITALAASGAASMVGLAWRQPARAAKRSRSARRRRRVACKRDGQCRAGRVCRGRVCKAGCRIGSTVYAPGAANASIECQSCQPAISTTAWTSTCDECEVCEPGTGECTMDPAKLATPCGEQGADGFRPGYCLGGPCESPCSEDCADYCYLLEDPSGQTNPFAPFCCPGDARGPDGACCWINQAAGIFVEGECTAPSQVCADRAACATECCGGSSSGFAGSCPSSTQFCVDGTTKDAGFACTTDQDCASAGYGASSVCAELTYSCVHDGEPIPEPGSGTCCPRSNISGPPGLACNGGPVYSCCPPATRFVDEGGCCDYPAYRLGCPACTCSFRNISRCC